MVQAQLRAPSGTPAAQSPQLPSYHSGIGSRPQHHVAPPRPPPGMPMAPDSMAQRPGLSREAQVPGTQHSCST